MIQSVNGASMSSVYDVQIKRTAWREEMLAQALSKVRSVSPSLSDGGSAKSRAIPSKGALVDVFA